MPDAAISPKPFIREFRHRLWPAVEAVRARTRGQRAALFRKTLSVGPNTTILDLGGGDGAHIAMLLDGLDHRPKNVCVADIDSKDLAAAEKRGFPTRQLTESADLPFADGEFDIVFCNSVIEHVGLPGAQSWQTSSEAEFTRICRAAQRQFASEVMRIGRSYFVQTPDRYFPLEPHSLLPFVAQLPRPLMLRVLRLSNRYWIKGTPPDFCAITSRGFAELFPEATILHERFLGLSKSLIAVRDHQ